MRNWLRGYGEIIHTTKAEQEQEGCLTSRPPSLSKHAKKNWGRKERDRRYRERLRQDPERYQRMLELTKQRQLRRKERLRQERLLQAETKPPVLGQDFIILVNRDGSPTPPPNAAL